MVIVFRVVVGFFFWVWVCRLIDNNRLIEIVVVMGVCLKFMDGF